MRGIISPKSVCGYSFPILLEFLATFASRVGTFIIWNSSYRGIPSRYRNRNWKLLSAVSSEVQYGRS